MSICADAPRGTCAKKKKKEKTPLDLESRHAEAATLKSSPTRIECARLPLV